MTRERTATTPEGSGFLSRAWFDSLAGVLGANLEPAWLLPFQAPLFAYAAFWIYRRFRMPALVAAVALPAFWCRPTAQEALRQKRRFQEHGTFFGDADFQVVRHLERDCVREARYGHYVVYARWDR